MAVGMRWPKWIVAALAWSVCALALGPSPVVGKVVKVDNHRFGLTATTQPPVATASCTTGCSIVTYHQGPVMHAEKFALIFWTPSGHAVPSTYQAGLGTWLSEVAARDYTAGNLFSVVQQYYDLSGAGGTKNFAPYGIVKGRSYLDTDPYPANGCTDTDGSGGAVPICLTDAQLRNELSTFIAGHKLPTGPGAGYLVLTPVNVGSCLDGTSGSASCSYTGYCAYHSFVGSGSSEILYADLPWQYRVSGCDTDEAFATGYPNGDAIDPAVGMASHEMSEIITDPNVNAWFDASGSEIGDKCSFIYGSGGFGSVAGLSNNGLGYYNYTFGTDDYLMQFEYDNRTQDCAQNDTDIQPSVTIAPLTTTHGTSTHFTATITDPVGLSSMTWNFGDGTSTSKTTTNTKTHTYAAPGTYTLTVVVSDNHGNEKKRAQTVTVT